MTRTFGSTGGLRLVSDEHGQRGDPPVLLLHGGGQTRHAWGGTAETLAAEGFHVVNLDQRGHGDSDWAPDGDYGHDAMITDVTTVARELTADAGGVEPALVGASMGGIISLLTLGERHGPGRALVLVDIATRPEVAGVDRILSFMRSAPEGFASLDDAADAVAAYQPHRQRPSSNEGLRKNLRQREDGRWYWHWDPAFLDPGDRPPRRTRDPERLDAAARGLDVPTLLVRGRMSDVVSEDSVRVFRELVPTAAFVDVAGAGHMVAGDRNDAFSGAVIGFLTGLDGG